MCTEEWLFAVSTICGFCNTSAENSHDGRSLYVEKLVHQVEIYKQQNHSQLFCRLVMCFGS